MSKYNLYDSTDRYRAAGMAYPKHPCKKCEGMGFSPYTGKCYVCSGTGDNRAKPTDEPNDGSDYC